MKKFFISILITLVAFNANAQEPTETGSLQGVITTGVPFLLIAGDARAAGMGDIGVVTSADAFSQQWNPAKYAFALKKQGVGITYTPYLSKLVNDIFLGNVTYYNRINEQSAVGASFRYFSAGEIELRDTPDQEPLIVKPNELMLDVSYSLRLSERFSMAVAGRFINSDLKLGQSSTSEGNAASTFAVDVAGYYQSEEIAYSDFDGRWRLGFNISNIGPKIKYDDAGSESNLPTNLALGGGFDFILDEYNKVGVSLEIDKLLVPTPSDSNGDGTIDRNDDYYKESFFSGMISSFGDGDNELKEYVWALGAEYWYQDAFAFRAGYFNEAEEAGSRKFLSLGAGFRYTAINFDISYLFSTSKVVSPLEGSLRFGLTFNFGDEYDEY
ncbi:type IX secretion system outer membrane channel protein PorV [Ulvibacter litoralis]|uniref:Type IX secretion system protein PorV domain-containing protein n=1 Tax=Ulvibacter litoralis TaxID=227084 RepID=A0A1G7C4A9_9FLAO|nr:type IX secretion system outer membrane channel protein PorV [Ulvibacter litoralis]GHC48967.1 hypothetical protein GCM10008083_10500 [Ulvibacter litoralis]SDE33265.1 hypothetical protein SAMN05421855_101136 [Ulvibacter litoralis]